MKIEIEYRDSQKELGHFISDDPAHLEGHLRECFSYESALLNRILAGELKEARITITMKAIE